MRLLHDFVTDVVMQIVTLALVWRLVVFFFFQAEDGIRDLTVTGVQTCALPILLADRGPVPRQKYAVASRGPDRLASRPHPRPHARAAAIASQAASSASVTPAWFPGHSLLAARSTTSVTTPSHTAAQTSAAPGFTVPSALPCAMRLSSPSRKSRVTLWLSSSSRSACRCRKNSRATAGSG